MITNNSSVGDLSKVLSPIEGIQLDPSSERLSEAERYAKFNAIAMDYMPPVAQAASGSTGTSGSTSSTTTATTSTTATNTPSPDDDDDDDDDGGVKAKKKTNPFQGLADGFNTYAAAIAQVDDEWWNEDKDESQKLEEFTVEFRPGKNRGADISEGKGEIEPDLTVGYGPDGKEIPMNRRVKASF